MRARFVRRAALAALALGVSVAAHAAATRLDLSAPAPAAYRDVLARVTALGGVAVHQFPPDSLIAELPSGAEQALGQVDGLRVSQVAPAPTMDARIPEPSLPETGDALVAPPRPGTGIAKSSGTGLNGISDYLLGSIAVGIVLVESDGGIDASTNDWTELRENIVIANVTEGLDWLRAQCPSIALAPTFTYRILRGRTDPEARTSYEPIERPTTDEPLWRDEIMNKVDSGAHAARQGLDKVASFNESLRQSLGTDWAFTIFVVDSDADFDGVFADGRFSYAYLGGPHFVMTWDNDGYTINEMRSVTAHSALHMFWALDEFLSAAVDCDVAAGYLAVPNQNSRFSTDGAGCETNVACVMRGDFITSSQIEDFTAGQVGWRDSDGDGLPDPIDTIPGLTLVSPESPLEGPIAFVGVAQDLALPNLNPRDPSPEDTTLNVITGIACSVNGGEPLPASAADGAFDQSTEAWALLTPPLPPGEHEITCTGTNSVGNSAAVPVSLRFTVGRRCLPEACDGIDNDCDELIDEDLGTLTCGEGPLENTVAACVDGVPQTCVPLTCLSGDIWPDGVGDGRVNLCDVILGIAKIAHWRPLNERDLECGDVAPGHFRYCFPHEHDHVHPYVGPWCTSGDDRIWFDDVLVTLLYAIGVTNPDCIPCDEVPIANAGAELRRAGDVAPASGGDAVVDIADVVRVLRLTVGLDLASAEELLRADVAPGTAGPDGLHVVGGDGEVSVADVVAILRASVGLSSLGWPERRMSVRVSVASVPVDGLMASVSGWPASAEPGRVDSHSCEPALGHEVVGAGDTWAWACTTDSRLVSGLQPAMTFTYRSPEPVPPSALTLGVEAVNLVLGPISSHGTLSAE